MGPRKLPKPTPARPSLMTFDLPPPALLGRPGYMSPVCDTCHLRERGSHLRERERGIVDTASDRRDAAAALRCPHTSIVTLCCGCVLPHATCLMNRPRASDRCVDARPPWIIAIMTPHYRSKAASDRGSREPAQRGQADSVRQCMPPCRALTAGSQQAMDADRYDCSAGVGKLALTFSSESETGSMPRGWTMG
jgi:hypothetical protein